jgi:hypothetical protein
MSLLLLIKPVVSRFIQKFGLFCKKCVTALYLEEIYIRGLGTLCANSCSKIDSFSTVRPTSLFNHYCHFSNVLRVTDSIDHLVRYISAGRSI